MSTVNYTTYKNTKDWFKRFVLPASLLLLFMFGILFFTKVLPDIQDKNHLRENGVTVVAEVINYKKGTLLDKPVYINQCKYNIEDSICFSYFLTKRKALPLHEKIQIRYYIKKDGSIIRSYPEKEKYEEKYGLLY